MENRFHSFFEAYQPQMDQLVKGEIDIPTWVPHEELTHITVEDRAFISGLKIPRGPSPSNHLPDMLLHGLGSFKEDPVLARRIQGLFGTAISK